MAERALPELRDNPDIFEQLDKDEKIRLLRWRHWVSLMSEPDSRHYRDELVEMIERLAAGKALS